MNQNKLNPGKLLDNNGHLTERGYAKSLIKEYSRKDIKANHFRIKEWDYYIIYNDDFGIALTLDDNSYMGLVSVSILDFNNRKQVTTSKMFPFPMGKTKLPASSKQGDSSYQDKNVKLLFKNDGKRRELFVEMKNFYQGTPLKASLQLTEEPRDSMVIATPFKEDKKAFFYNQKIVGMRARGKVEYMGDTYLFQPENSFGTLDWGRGVWTYDNVWYWGAGQGLVDGKVFGFNIGYGFGDTSAATENMLFYDGVAHKLEEVKFHIPIGEKGIEDYGKPWIFTSSDQRFEMYFSPILDRSAYTSLGIILSDQHQVFGYFDGKAVLEDGTEINLKHFLGFAEKVRNKW